MRRLKERPPSDIHSEAQTLFPSANVSLIVKTISEDAVFVGMNLPPHIVPAIDDFARTEPLHTNYDPNGPTFRYSEVIQGKAPTAVLSRSAAFAG